MDPESMKQQTNQNSGRENTKEQIYTRARAHTHYRGTSP